MNKSENINTICNNYLKDIKPGNKIDIDSALLNYRIIFFNDSVNANSCSRLIKLLILLSKESKKDIHLFINTPGGSIYDALSVCNIIEEIPCDVRTIGIGVIYSAGTVLITGGTHGKRGAFKNTDFLVHQPSIHVSEKQIKLSDLEVTTNEMKKARDTLLNHYIKNTKLNKKQAIELLSKESFFDVQEALKYNLIDYVVNKY